MILDIGRGHKTIIDDHFVEQITRWKWCSKTSSRKYSYAVYARRKGGGRYGATILLHHYVMELAGKPRPSPDHEVDHLNSNSLDNQEHNLDWKPKGKNRGRMSARRQAYHDRGSHASA